VLKLNCDRFGLNQHLTPSKIIRYLQQPALVTGPFDPRLIRVAQMLLKKKKKKGGGEEKKKGKEKRKKEGRSGGREGKEKRSNGKGRGEEKHNEIACYQAAENDIDTVRQLFSFAQAKCRAKNIRSETDERIHVPLTCSFLGIKI